MQNRPNLIRLLVLVAALVAAALPARALDRRAEPEAATRTSGNATVAVAHARHDMVVTANPLASRVARDMLRQGGSAVDATIAAQLVLNLVEPQSSGLGGGAFLVHWDARRGNLSTLDGRETAPMAAKPDRFMRNEKPMSFKEAVSGGLSVGVPGVARLLGRAWQQHGRLPWPHLFAPAIRLAEEGFAVSPRLNELLAKADPVTFDDTARSYFFDVSGKPRQVGERLRNPQFAATLRLIARLGPDAFYEGPIATQIVAAVTGAARNPGDITAADLSSYRVVERPPVCFSYRSRRICGMGPPSSGLLTLAQTLKLLERFGLGRAPMNRQALHLIVEAEKLAYADRDRYIADSDFVDIPAGLLDPAYLAARARLIDPGRTMGKAEPGEPPQRGAPFGEDATRENNGTSHISVVDAEGNAVALTSSIEGAFGSRLMAAGFLLNNELTDFSFEPEDEKGRPVANRVEGGKRPRSSMAPVFVFAPDDSLEMVAGSPGGTRIILYLVKALIAHIDWGLAPGNIAALPNFGSRNGPLELEAGIGADQAADEMRASFGHEVKISSMTSGLGLITLGPTGLTSAADPRREGLPLGDAQSATDLPAPTGPANQLAPCAHPAIAPCSPHE